jgi:DNA-binding transcriptional regulator LsrR (DeoR family)
MEIVLRNPDVTQEEIGKRLGIKQNSVSGRWNRAYVNEILEVERMYRKKIKKLLG